VHASYFAVAPPSNAATLARFVYALGIREVGENTAKLLAKNLLVTTQFR